MNFRHYLALVVAAIVPIWSGRWLPTIDGPSHVYNAWILQELLRGHHLASQWYAIDWRPNPNWSGHALLALFMTVFPARIAEKLLVSGIVLLFAVAMWMYTGLADEAARPFAVVTLPFAYHLMLQAGFYNFSIGAALYFLTVAVWWRRRGIAIVAALLLFCYFSHPLPAMLAVMTIGILCVAARRWRDLVALVPVSLLLAWFFATSGSTVEGPHRSAADLFRYLEQMWVIVALQQRQQILGTALFFVLAVLIVLTFVRRRWRWSEGDALIVVTLLLIALYARSPAVSSGGSMILERMALFVVLSPLAWIAPRLPRPAVVAFVIIAAMTSLVYDGYLVRQYRGLSRRMDELVRSASALGSNTTFIPLIRDIRPRSGVIAPVLMHAIDYVAVEKRSIDLLNYEPRAGYFPVAMHVKLPAVVDVGSGAVNADISAYVPAAESIYTWHIPADAPVATRIARDYDVVTDVEGGRVYRRRR